MTDVSRKRWLLTCLLPALLLSFTGVLIVPSIGVIGVGVSMVAMTALLATWRPKDEVSEPLRSDEAQTYISVPNDACIIAFGARTNSVAFRYPRRSSARLARLLRMTASYIEGGVP